MSSGEGTDGGCEKGYGGGARLRGRGGEEWGILGQDSRCADVLVGWLEEYAVESCVCGFDESLILIKHFLVWS